MDDLKMVQNRTISDYHIGIEVECCLPILSKENYQIVVRLSISQLSLENDLATTKSLTRNLHEKMIRRLLDHHIKIVQRKDHHL